MKMNHMPVALFGEERGIVMLGQDNGQQQPGQICLVNEARFTAANFSEPLTTFAVGWKAPEDVQRELDIVCPRVLVARRFEYKSATNAEEFLSEADDIRSVGAAFKRVESKGTSVNSKTHNKGLTLRLDRDEMIPGDEERAVQKLLRRLLLNDLRRGYTGLVAGATNTAKTWNSSSDPDMDVLTDIDTGGDARGIDGNIVVYGKSAWLKRQLALRASDKAGAFAGAAIRTPEELAAQLGVDKVLVSKVRYQSSSTAKSKAIGGAYVLMYYAQEAADREDASNIKRFVTPTEAGDYRVYREEHAKFIDISVEHYSHVVVTSTLGIRMFTVS